MNDWQVSTREVQNLNVRNAGVAGPPTFKDANSKVDALTGLRNGQTSITAPPCTTRVSDVTEGPVGRVD